MNSTEIARLHATVSADTTQADRNLRGFKGELAGTSRAAQQSSSGINLLGKAAGALGGAFAAIELADTVKQLYTIGDASLKAERGLTAVAGSAQAAADITAAVKTGSAGLLTQIEAQTSATRLLSLGIANNADEAGRFTQVAATLGAVIGQDATTSVEQLSLAVANLSYERLDALGISAGRVRERVAELKEEGHNTEDAFRMATLEIATGKLEALEAAGFEAGTSLERLTVKAQDAAGALGEQLATGVLSLTDAIEENWGVLVEYERTLAILSGSQRGQQILLAESAEAARVHTEASNLLAVAEQNVAEQMRQIPLEDTQAQTWLVADAFMEVARQAGYTDAQLIALWETTGGTADEMTNLYANSVTIPPSMAAIEGSSYGAAQGMTTAAIATRDFKDAIDELNNQRTGNYGRGTAVTQNLPMDAQSFRERRDNSFAAQSGMSDTHQGTPQYLIDRANRLNEMYEQLNDVRWESGIGWQSTAPVGGGSRGGGGARSAGRSAGAAMGGDYATGLTEGLVEALTPESEYDKILERVSEFLDTRKLVGDIRAKLNTDLAGKGDAAGIDAALGSLFGDVATTGGGLGSDVATAFRVGIEGKLTEASAAGAAFGKAFSDAVVNETNDLGARVMDKFWSGIDAAVGA